MHIVLELGWKFCEHIHHGSVTISNPDLRPSSSSQHMFFLLFAYALMLFYSCVIYFIRKLCHPHPFHLIQASIFISIFLSPSFSLWINNFTSSPLCASVLLLVKAPPRNSITQLLFYDVVLSADDDSLSHHSAWQDCHNALFAFYSTAHARPANVFARSRLQSCLWSPLPSAPWLSSSCPQTAGKHWNPAVVILSKTPLCFAAKAS